MYPVSNSASASRPKPQVESVGTLGTNTARIAVAALPPLGDTKILVVLTFVPAVVAVTVTPNVHGAPFATVAPEREMTLFETVRLPPHCGVGPEFGAVKPAGSVSLKETPVSVPVAGSVMVKVRVVDPLIGRLVTPNAFERVGCKPGRPPPLQTVT